MRTARGADATAQNWRGLEASQVTENKEIGRIIFEAVHGADPAAGLAPPAPLAPPVVQSQLFPPVAPSAMESDAGKLPDSLMFGSISAPGRPTRVQVHSNSPVVPTQATQAVAAVSSPVPAVPAAPVASVEATPEPMASKPVVTVEQLIALTQSTQIHEQPVESQLPVTATVAIEHPELSVEPPSTNTGEAAVTVSLEQ